MERKGGRKEDDFWQYVDKKNGNKCIYCGHGIPGASRIKFHLAQITGRGIYICEKVPDDVKTAAALALNSSNKRAKQYRAPSDLNEDNITTRGKNIMEGKGGRKGDVFWQYVDEEKKCNYCGIQIPGASRIKFHLAQITGGGIRPCNKVPDDIKSAAISALNSPNKRVKQSGTPSDFDKNNINSNLSMSPTKGPIEIDLLPTTDLVGQQFQSYLEEIWKWVMRDDEMSIMGVWGMGGVGKTELLKHIHNKLLNQKHHVIWATVSQNCSIRQLQTAIAMSIDEHILKIEDEVKITARLLHAFKKMDKCLLILDDVWYDIILENVGIPLAYNGIKIIIASRLLDVCKSIGCKENIVKVEPFSSQDEAFSLFLKSLGDDVTLPNNIKEIAEGLTRLCNGLPLAIVTVARSMRGKADIREWTNALSKLTSPEMDHGDIKRCVFPKLKSSFDHLNDWTLQDCLLCLALYYPFRFHQFRREVIRNFIDEGLINGRQDFAAQLDEGHRILNELVNNSLLLEFEYRGLLLNRLVWAMAVNIGKESHGYMYKEELPDEQEWKEDLQKISFRFDKITKIPFAMSHRCPIEIPFAMSHRCPKLTTFRMYSGYCFEVIPDNFFTNMRALKILDMSYNMSIKVLPASISNLECLTVLLLAYCKSLCHIPSLAKLRKLRKLDLHKTRITQIPLGFENLTNLIWLDLGGPVVMKAQDLEGLQMLENIAATFVDRDAFIACVRIIDARVNSGLMKGYYLQLLGDATDVHRFRDNFNDIDNDKTVNIESVEHCPLLLPTAIDLLKIEYCDLWESLCDVFSIQLSNELHISLCRVEHCDRLDYLFCSSDDCIFCFSLQGLNELYLYGLDSLSMLCKENQMASSFLPFFHLRKLSISRCKGMKKLLTPGMSRHLHNLEEIDVSDCDSMEEIFPIVWSANYHDVIFGDELLDIEPYAVDMDDTNVEAIHLPNLKSVSLCCLPQLNSVCKGIIISSSLKKFEIIDCPKLKCIPQTQPPFEIQVEDEEFS